jgi:hypothetical protein
VSDETKSNGGNPSPSEHDTTPARRRLLKALAGAGGVFAAGKSVPEKWTRPVVDSVLLPAHAQATGNGPWSGNGTATTFGPGPDKGLGGRLLDAVIPQAEAGVKDGGGLDCPNIYVCIEMVGAATAKVTITDCCGGQQSQNTNCTVTGGNKLNNCQFGGYTVNATLSNNQWIGTVEGECPCFDEGANEGETSPFDPQRKLLARTEQRGVAERMLDAVVSAAHAGDAGDLSMDTIWEFTLTQGGCNTSNFCRK